MSSKNLQKHHKFLSTYDLNEYTKEMSLQFGLHFQTVQIIKETYAKSRKRFKKAKLNWQTNNQEENIRLDIF